MTKHSWPEDREAELRRMYEAGEAIAEIAHHFGVVSLTITRKIEELKLTPRPRANAWTEENIALMIERRKAGDSFTVIAARLGVTRNAVCGRLARLGIVLKPLPRRASAPKPRTRTYIAPRLVAPIPPPRPTTPDDMGWSAHARPFMLTTRKQCRWPLGPASDLAHSMMMVCAGPVVEGRPYCPDHCERAGNGYTHTKRIKPPYESTVIRRAV